jgi:predicted transcriptional regulator
MKDHLVARLKDLPAYSLLVLDCAQVQFMDYSWADEVVASLVDVAHTSEGQLFVVVRGPSQSVAESIKAAVTMHGLTCVRVDQEGVPTVLGGLSPALLQTYNLAVTRGQISALDLPDSLSPSTKSNRLKELERRGLLYRVGEEIIEGGGRRFIYEPVR